MFDFWEVFPKGNAFLPVIHAQTELQVLRNAEIAYKEGADGIFLINHSSIAAASLLKFYESAREMYPSWWIGLNFLSLSTSHALMRVPPGASGLWVDDAGINEISKDPCRSARMFWEQRQKRKDWQGLYLGGVAFKYQPRVQDVAHVAKLAVPYMDVITTSGDATGKPPTPEKILAMRHAVGEHPIVIASGITAENVEQYLNLADGFLVATGISSSFTELDSTRVKKLRQAIDSG